MIGRAPSSASCLSICQTDAVLEPVETANWFPKIYRKDYTIAINGTESGVDDPDQQFYETLSVGRCATTPVIAIRRLTS